MRHLVMLFLHVIVTIIRLMGPGGIRSVVAGAVLVKHQLLILVAMDQDTRVSRPVADLHTYRGQSHCRGLYQTPLAA